ncbi:MAG: metal ABC transporter substrate-binding protein [Candidatus Aureabacteria bacterium]|nr:metal ABC transporter substrate-binding protein [Candidatus Auribacterota bacterium]
MNCTCHALLPFSLIGQIILSPPVAVSTSASAKGREMLVVTSFYPIYIMALNVVNGVPGISVQNLPPPSTGCLHDYSLTVKDMKKLAHASILLTNGAGMESFIERAAQQYPRLTIVPLAQGIPLIHGDRSGTENPHVWVSVSDAIIEVNNLGKAMEAVDPARAQLYRAAASLYVAKLEDLRARMHAALSPYRGRKIITFHEAFAYFAQEFGLDIAAVVEREPGSQPSAQELAHTIDLVKKNGIRVIFSEPQYPASAAEAIARETGAHVYMLDPAVTGPDAPDAYLRIMESNLAVLTKALR